MNYKRLFADLEESAINMRNAYGQAFLAIDSDPRLALLAEMAVQIGVRPYHGYQNSIDKLTGGWHHIYDGGYSAALQIPYEYKYLVREYLIDLGLIEKVVDVNCYLMLSETFYSHDSPVQVMFYKKVSPGDRYNGCTIMQDEEPLKIQRYSIACKKDKVDAAA